MRAFCFALIGLLAVGLAAPAQQPETLDSVLRGWEKAMTDLTSFYSKVDRSTLDKALGAKDDHSGYAMFVKAASKNDASRARLELTKTTNPKVFEKYICTGTFLYEYAPANNKVRIHNMPNNKNGMQQESFLSFLFGMSAEDAKRRYNMTHVLPKVPDKFYHYIRIQPKLEQDKSDFLEARLTLFRSNNMPAQIWYLQPNKNEITWTFKEMYIDPKGGIPLKYFEPDQPKGWTVERVQPKTPPVKLAPTVRN